MRLREAIAACASGAVPVSRWNADNVIFLAGAQNALFVASMCIAGPGDEVIALEPLYPSYPATIEVSGARMVRVPAAGGERISPRLGGARGGDHAAHARAVFRHAEQSRAA